MKRYVKYFIISSLVFLGWIVYVDLTKTTEAVTPEYTRTTYVMPPEPQVSDIDRDELLSLTNQNRTEHGRHNLRLNTKLNASAQAKCEDMAKRDYWSHNTPEGSKPWVFIDKYLDSPVHVGENLAYGMKSAEGVVNGWMISKPHKEALLHTNYTDVGFGVCKADQYQNEGLQLIIVQHFIG